MGQSVHACVLCMILRCVCLRAAPSSRSGLVLGKIWRNHAPILDWPPEVPPLIPLEGLKHEENQTADANTCVCARCGDELVLVIPAAVPSAQVGMYSVVVSDESRSMFTARVDTENSTWL